MGLVAELSRFDEQMNELSILNLIGNTPMVKIQNPGGPKRAHVFGKLEGNNPGGSIKDRVALYMIEKAEEAGLLAEEKSYWKLLPETRE